MAPEMNSAPALLEAERESLMAPDQPEALPRVMPDRALAQAQGIVAELLPELDADAARPDGQRVYDLAYRERLRQVAARIVQLALIYYAATLEWQTFQPPDSEAAARTRRLRTADEELFTWLWPRYRHHPIFGPALIIIRRGQGKEDDAHDVLGETSILRADLKDNPNALAGLPWTLADLMALEVDATTQIAALNQLTPAENAARRLRYRAWARFIEAYELLRRAGLGLTADGQRFALLKNS